MLMWILPLLAAVVVVPGSGSAWATQGSEISTVIGGDVPGPGPAADLRMSPTTVTPVSGGLLIVDGNVLRRLDQSGRQTVVASTGDDVSSGDGGPATSAGFGAMGAVSVDPHGNWVVPDRGRIRVVAASSGLFYGQAMTAGDVYTIAGTGTPGNTGDGGPATSAQVALGETAIDPAGNVVFCEDNQVRVVAVSTGVFYGIAMAAGDIYTIAGGSAAGYGGDGGSAGAAVFNGLSWLVGDRHGNLVVVDLNNARIRVIAAQTGQFYGVSMTAGDVYTVAGNGGAGFAGDGGPGTSAEFHAGWWSQLAVDNAGNLLLADTGNGRVRVLADGPGDAYGWSLAAGEIQTVMGGGDANGSGARIMSLHPGPSGVAVDAAGNVLLSRPDAYQPSVEMWAPTSGTFYGLTMGAGQVASVAGGNLGVAGNGDPATSVQLWAPSAVTVDGQGNTLVADKGHSVVRVLAGSTGTFYGVPMSAGGLYTAVGVFSGSKYWPSSDLGTPATGFILGHPTALHVDLDGNLLLTDVNHQLVFAVAGSDGTYYGQSMLAGHIYAVVGSYATQFTTSGCGPYCNGGNGGDGGPASSAQLSSPEGLTTDSVGNLIFADTADARVRVRAALTGTFYGVPMIAGNVYTVAGGGSGAPGGPATDVGLNLPSNVAVDRAGNLLITSADGLRVVATTTGYFYGTAMTAAHLYKVDGGAVLGNGLAVDAAGNVVLTGGYQVGVLAESSGTYYGTAMTPGQSYVLAGSYFPGFHGDGGPPGSATLRLPTGVATDPAGDLLVADTGNDRIRLISGGPQAPITVPSAPRTVRASTGSAGASLTWLPPAQYGGAAPTSYGVYRSASPDEQGTLVGTTTGSSFLDEGVPRGVPTYYRIAAVNSAGTGADSLPAVVTADGTAPTVRIVAPAGPFQLGATTTVRYAATDPDDAVSSYDVRFRTSTWNGVFGPYQYPAAWQGTRSTSQAVQTAPGREYCFGTRARDSSGNVSPWTPDRCSARPLDDRALSAITSGWVRGKSPATYLATYTRTATRYATLQLANARFRQAALVVTRCATCGSVLLSLNGGTWRSVSTYHSTTQHQVILVLPTLSARTATIRLRATGTKPLVIEGLGIWK